MGLQLPLQVNVADYAIDAIETLQQQQREQPQLPQPPRRGDEGEFRSGRFTLQQLFQQSKVVDEEVVHVGIDLPCGFANSRLRETIVLTHRFSKNIFRTKELFACRKIQI
uniref:Uncharacterized protein n=1 Tax=Nelumbo nucifera TaxID=4432 RepID=A0A822YVU1_NELNU|nr:TPA_asm: hypothetical protein HUJ06_006311 [Nelumbo nucifera]